MGTLLPSSMRIRKSFSDNGKLRLDFAVHRRIPAEREGHSDVAPLCVKIFVLRRPEDPRTGGQRWVTGEHQLFECYR
jgi:hypothetical protein